MSKCAAVIQLGWMTECFEADDPCGIMREAERVQDFRCLLQMGRMQEDKNGQKELSKLEDFLEKYYGGSLTMDDIKTLDIHLSIANITCLGVANSEAEIEALKAANNL